MEMSTEKLREDLVKMFQEHSVPFVYIDEVLNYIMYLKNGEDMSSLEDFGDGVKCDF